MEKFVDIVILIGAFIGAVSAIILAVQKLMNKILSPVVKTVEGMDERQCRMWLVDFLNDVENGVEKDEVQYKFAHEVYDHYTNDLHKNSYIHDKWNRIMR